MLILITILFLTFLLYSISNNNLFAKSNKNDQKKTLRKLFFYFLAVSPALYTIFSDKAYNFNPNEDLYLPVVTATAFMQFIISLIFIIYKYKTKFIGFPIYAEYLKKMTNNNYFFTSSRPQQIILIFFTTIIGLYFGAIFSLTIAIDLPTQYSLEGDYIIFIRKSYGYLYSYEFLSIINLILLIVLLNTLDVINFFRFTKKENITLDRYKILYLSTTMLSIITLGIILNLFIENVTVEILFLNSILLFFILSVSIYHYFYENPVFKDSKITDFFEFTSVMKNPDSKSEINYLLKYGESLKFEAKSTLYHCMRTGEYRKDLSLEVVKAIAGFMNGKGGTLIIGVEEDSENNLSVKGSLNTEIKKHWKNSIDKFQRDGFSRLITQTFRSDVLPLIETKLEKFNAYFIFIVNVSPNKNPVWVGKPFFDNKEGEKFYLRKEAQTVELKGKNITDYLSNKEG